MYCFVYDDEKAYIFKENREERNVPNLKEIGQVKWRGTNVVINLMYTKNCTINKNIKRKIDSLYPLLKSNLQKQIRRKEVEAVATAELMLELNDFELLRRLSVIAAEDCEITKETSIIVWLMSAVSKGFILSLHHKNFILSYVAALVNSTVCRRLEINQIYNSNLDFLDILNSKHPDKNYLAGIFFRVSYGGLEGDLPMISYICDEVLQTGRPLENSNLQLKSVSPKLKFNDAAVDFHIYPNLCNEIYNDVKTNPNFILAAQNKSPQDVIRSVIWICSSGINLRHLSPIDPYQLHVWNIICSSFAFHTKTYLSKILKG